MNSNASATAARKHRNPNQAFTAFNPSANAPRWRTLVPDPIHKRPQLPRATRMAQLPQRLGFDLADAFAGGLAQAGAKKEQLTGSSPRTVLLAFAVK